MKIPSLSIIIPVYNEERCLTKSLDKVLRFLKANVKDFEVIVVDDGSSDSTPEILRRFKEKVRVLRNEPNRGKGFSVKKGFLASSRPWTLFMDADLSTPLDEINHLWPFHRTQDMIFASRSMPGSRIIERQGGFRRTLGRGFSWLGRLLALPGFYDTHLRF